MFPTYLPIEYRCEFQLSKRLKTAKMTRTMPFDPKALQRKYDEERDKRLSYKQQGTEEYQSMNESFSAMLSDPYAQGAVERPPRYDQCDVLVIGGGFGGQLMAVRLLEQGITNFRIVEKGADFGGTWCVHPLAIHVAI